MTADEMIRKMGEALGNEDGDGRHPDIEQDAMRYWVLRELICSSPVGEDRLDQTMDEKIKRILK